MNPMLGAGQGDLVGRSLDELPTPLLCLDVDALERNIEAMTAMCHAHGKQWRPHIKAHRCPAILERLKKAGWQGVTCATAAEAQVAVAWGLTDVLIANQLVGANLERAIRLAHIAAPILTFDSLDQVHLADQLAHRYGVRPRAIVELDIGMGRAGVADMASALGLAEAIDRTANLEFVGVMGYEGHLLAHPDREEKARLIFESLDRLAELVDRIRKKGLNCNIVSAGGTGSCETTVRHPAVTELQAGGLVFMDAYYRHRCGVQRFEHALTVESSITSVPAADRAIMDAGRKTHDISLCEPEFIDPPRGLSVRSLSAEHGVLQVSPQAPPLRPGSRVRFVPGYSDFTMMLHPHLVAHRNRTAIGLWPIGPRN